MPQRRLVYSYALLVGVPLLCLLGALGAGRSLVAPVVQVLSAHASTGGASSPPTLVLPRLVLQVLVILAVSRATSWVFGRIHQPQVIGEMAAGIALGPSLFGWLAPSLSRTLFPPSSLDYLNALSQLGLLLFMFLVGLSLNSGALREHSHSVVLTSHVSIAVPYCLGTMVALILYPKLSTRAVGFTGFALFLGAAMSITAFPVLARILAERNLLRTRLGTIAIACAAVDDVTGWCVLACIVVLIQSSRALLPFWLLIGGALVYVVAMLFGLRRLLPRFETSFREHGRMTENAAACMVLLILASALCTESLGIHLLFGAFILGAIMPKGIDFVNHVRQRFESITVILLLPIFFAYTGLRTNLGIVRERDMLLYTLVALAVAVIGKVGGCLGAGRLTGMPWRDAAALGVLMNTRGLMELVILNIGLDIGVISPAVFSMMVTVALVTTLMTTPLLDLLFRGPQLEAELLTGRVA